MARKEDWIPIFWRDWIRATMALSPGQLGCLMNLLMNLDGSGPIPAEKDILKRVSGCIRRGEWSKYGRPVLEKFFELKDRHYVLRPEYFEEYQRVTIYELRNMRPPPDIWREMKREVFERDDFTCTYCGARGSELHCDHIVPVSRGGSSRKENLTTACGKCNRLKGARTVEEWLNERT